MKALIMIATLLTSVSVFAADCSVDATEIAKTNLDQVARKYGFESSYVEGPAKLVKKTKVEIVKGIYETLSVYSSDGYIYKGEYTITVTVDSSCAVRNLKIHDNSTL